jgi:plastocyanin
VTGTTTDLSVLGADDLGEADLTYNWAITSQPAGSNPQFSANNSNGSKDSTVTFDEAGEYVFTCTITDSLGASVTSSVDVTVNQTLTSILVTPGNTVLNENQTQPLNAVARDQFGDPLSTQPTINWSLAGGIGDIDSTGVYTSNGAAGSAVISATAAGITGHGWVTVRNAAPTVVTAAAAAPATVTGTTTALSILGADDGGEANLIYTWSATTEPSGATPLFSANGTNAAQNATVTFNQAGDYTFTCTISDGQGGAVTSSVNVTVDQTLTSLAVSPGTAAINLNGTQALTAIGYDQFNNQMATQPAFTWAIQSGAGSVDGAGNFTAPAADGSTTVSASVGALVSDATISYTNAGPQLTSAAAASQSTVTGTTVDLSVLASDDLGSSNLTYTWAASTKPEETNPHFSVNSSNSSNDTTVTFEKAGDYVFTCTITDSLGASITSSVTVTAAQTFTRIRLTPGTAHINENQTQQFSASALDQFGDTLRNRPTFIWSQAAVGGSIDSSGDYTAPGVPSTDTVTATASGISAMVTVDVTDSAPTIAVQPAASSSIVAGTTVDLSVLGASDGGESNLTYMWQATSQPVGSNPQFSANGSNAAKNTTVTFDSAGDYTFTVTITDAQGLSTSAAVSVAVDQTATSIVVTPISATIAEQGTESLTASELDQFGAAMASQPAFAWSVQGVGSVDSQGTYNAPAAAGSATVTAGDGSLAGAATISIINTPPTVATAAAASASTVTGTTVGLSVLGADDGGQSNLTYTWTAIGASPTCGTFTDNGDNSAQNTIVTFTQPGTYDLQATITDSGGLSVTSDITVNVVSTLTTISVTPASAVLDENASQQFVALALDQFGNALATQPTFTWAVTNGPGSIDEAGLYSANTTTGSATVTASSGGVVGTSQLNVRNAPPTVAIAASATASAIISRSTHLSVLGADDGGEENLTYTWAAIGKSPASVSFEINGTNAAKDTVATFSASGDYELRVTITDADGLTATSKVDVHVDQTLTSIAVNPGDVSVDPNTTIQLKAVGYDQFGAVMVSQPLVKWSVDGVGAIDQSGAYESGSADGTAVITANADGLHGEAFLLVGSNSVSPVTPPTPPLVPQPSPDVPIVVVPEPSPSPSNATPAPSPEPDPTPLPIINPGGNNSPTPTPLPAPKANGTPGNNGQTQQTKNGSQGNNNPAAGPVATPGSQVHSQFTPSEVAAHLAMKVHEQDMHLLQQEFTTIGEKLAPPSHMNRTVRAVIGSASAMAGTAVVGYVLWILRSSSLLAGALAGLPMWRFLDPLPVLDQWKSKKSDDDQDDSDKDQSTRKLEEMFK